ncbi:MAG: hypothetical protein JSR54_01075 [Proteobacteria bacterium]|nr:hypothetical protein [Pseudomonadota bacterium]
MTPVRPGEPGRTRVCPHCKSTILESADVCPGCHHHLRFGAAPRQGESSSSTVFRLEGQFANDQDIAIWEYNLIVALFDERGAEIARKVVHVGALAPREARRCLVSLEAQVATPAPSPRAPLPRPRPPAAAPRAATPPARPPRPG